jgi:hypothetical protein
MKAIAFREWGEKRYRTGMTGERQGTDAHPIG